MDYESTADPNRCLLPADLLTPPAAAETAFLAGQTVSPRTSHMPLRLANGSSSGKALTKSILLLLIAV
jgi:hypothetical protein